MDPRSKIAGSILLICVALFANDWDRITVLFAFTMLAVTAGGFSLRALLRGWYSLSIFILITVTIHVIVALLYGQDASPGAGFLLLPGLAPGLLFGVKILTMGAVMFAALQTTHPAAISRAISDSAASWLPSSRSLRKLGLIMGLAVRFLPLALQETGRIRRAQVSRGLVVTGGPMQRVKSLLPLVSPLVSSSFDRADRITIAMISRGYDYSSPRTIYQPLRFGWRDAIGLAVVAASLVVIVTV